MSALASTAIIVCVSDEDGFDARTHLLGLEIGERILLTLERKGFARVVFVGSGARPQSARSQLPIGNLADIDLERPHLVIPSDAVFDTSLLDLRGQTTPTPSDEGALILARGPELERWLEEPLAMLAARAPSRRTDGQGFSLRVSDRAAHKTARRALLRSLRKPVDGLVSRHLNRYVSLAVTRYLVQTGISPNFFTVVFMALGLAAAALAAVADTPWMLVWAGVLVQAQSILDGCDGEMARLTYRFSKAGQWLDSIGDDLTNYAFCFGLALGQARLLDVAALYWLGAIVLLMQLTVSGLLYRRMILMGTGDLLAIPDTVASFDGSSRVSRFLGFCRQLFKRDAFVFIIAVVTVAQQPLVAFSLLAFGTIIAFGGVILNERRLSQLDPAKSDSHLVASS